jgi:hypothetical protein
LRDKTQPDQLMAEEIRAVFAKVWS